MNTQDAINILISHDMVEEAEKLQEIMKTCSCVNCQATSQQTNPADGERACEACGAAIPIITTKCGACGATYPCC